MVHIVRIDDNKFVFIAKTSNQEVILKIDSQLGDPEFRFNLAQKIADSISKGNPVDLFHLGNRKWSLVTDSRTPIILKAARPFSTMLQESTEDNVLRFSVLEYTSASVTGVNSAAIEQEKNLKFEKNLSSTNYKCLKDQTNLTKVEFDNHIRGKILLLPEVHPLAKSQFSDPFTELATLAFQRLEPSFISKDYMQPEDCEFCFVKVNNDLVLVNQKNPQLHSPRNTKEAVQLYKEYLIREYGREKIEYIQFLYKIDLDKTEVLTPEHIYRFNMGVNNLEVQDLENFLARCHEAIAWFDPFAENSFEEEDLQETLSEHFKHSFPEFHDREKRGILAALREDLKTEPTVNDFREWLYGLAPLPVNIDEVSPAQLQSLMRVFKLKPEELNAALTGRRIYEFIRSGYTNAEKKEYKPWVEQQQLLQIIPKLESSKDLLEFHEKLAFVVAKNHLVREHPTEHFRVGAIIPGPKDRNGQEHFYKVTSFISNSFGIVSMTLERVGDDPQLTPIKIYRSTASSSSSLQAAESVLNDLFIVSSPSYKGMNISDPYESIFYHQRTIPIWVGYLTLASNAKTPNTIELATQMSQDLTLANQTLFEEFEQEHAVKDLRAIFKTDPFIEEMLLSDEVFWGVVKSDVDSNMMVSILNLLEHIRFYKGSKDLPDPAKERKLAANFLKELEKIPLDKQSHKVQAAGIKIKKELYHHILSRAGTVAAKVERKKFDKLIFKKVQHLQALTEKAIEEDNLEEANALMSTWQKALSEYAEKKGEAVEDKVAESFSITGHSLGGACVQSQFANQITNRRRMPLPGQSVMLYEFDSPAIEEEDNAFAKSLILGHADMLRRSQVGFYERRHQEKGDIVPIAGKEHLFAANDIVEEMQMDASGVLFIEQAVRQRMPHAKTSSIAQSKFAHETRFGEGVRQRTFFDSEPEGDFIETYYTPFIQKIFDHAGNFGSKEESIQFRKRFEHYYKNLWGLSDYGGVWTPSSAESLRTSPSVSTVMIRKAIKEFYTQEDSTVPFQDENGAFAIFLNNVA